MRRGGRKLSLLDVESIEGRTTILYLEGSEDSGFDSMLMADLAGGAPLLIARADGGAEQGRAGVVPTGVIGGSLSEHGAAVIWSYGDIEASCSYVEVLDFDGDLLFGPIPKQCGELDFTQAALSPDGDRIAVAGEDLVQDRRHRNGSRPRRVDGRRCDRPRLRWIDGICHRCRAPDGLVPPRHPGR